MLARIYTQLEGYRNTELEWMVTEMCPTIRKCTISRRTVSRETVHNDDGEFLIKFELLVFLA